MFLAMNTRNVTEHRDLSDQSGIDDFLDLC